MTVCGRNWSEFVCENGVVVMLGMNKAYIWESVMHTWVVIDYLFSHSKLILISSISHTIFKIAMDVCLCD